MADTPRQQRPVKLVGCFFCGRKSQRPAEENRPDYCDQHWKILTAIAPAPLVEQHRRQFLHTGDATRKRSTLKDVIRELKAMRGMA